MGTSAGLAALRVGVSAAVLGYLGVGEEWVGLGTFSIRTASSGRGTC